MANLLESYKNRLSLSEAVYQKSHNGARMSNSKKLLIATVLNNTSKFVNEAFDSSAATQRSALGEFKKFCLNISTVALPNLILPELMLTHPMTSMTGYVTYLKYQLGATKGDAKQGTMVNSVYRHGEMDEARVNYTSDRIVETVKTGEVSLAWAPVVEDAFIDAEGKAHAVKFFPADGSEASFLTVSDGKVTAPKDGKIAYVYNNVIIPQNQVDVTKTYASIPTLTAKMEGITLVAHARRIAVYYSQIAAFQAKTDYGYDLAEQLSAQAQGELAYEIDTEGVLMLEKGAEEEKELTFKSYELDAAAATTYISRSQYYEQFSEIIARAKKVIYQRTQKFAPNYMVVGANIVTILPYLKGWTAAPASAVNGPYFAGTVDGLKVFVSPSIDENKYFFGVNGSDLQTSAAVYAPYMAIVPTQLLGFADGGNSQGFSTLYDMKLLSTYNRKGTEIVEPKEGETGDFSWLLVAGKFITDEKDLPAEEVTEG